MKIYDATQSKYVDVPNDKRVEIKKEIARQKKVIANVTQVFTHGIDIEKAAMTGSSDWSEEFKG